MNPLKVRFTEYGYGFFPGGDPRRFMPDGDSTETEVANHKAACAAWDRGEQQSRADCTHGPGFVVTVCQFGLGTYDYDEELWLWDWARWVWWPHFKNRAWWLWHTRVTR